MAARLGSWLMRPWTWRALWRDVRLAARLLREPHVPLWTKATIPLALLYLVSPVDFLPDVIPGIGQIDDLVLLYAALRLFLHVSPTAARTFHQDAIVRRRPFTPMPPSEVVIDAEFRRDI
jgi:uncharacterized membrane protein YkvA (DUF1232 family)